MPHSICFRDLASWLAPGSPSRRPCERCGVNRSSDSAANHPRRAPVAGLGPAELRLAPPRASEHRIVLDDRATCARLRDSAKRETPAWRIGARTLRRSLGSASIDSGYQGFEWADAVANLALCYHATGRESYAKSAAGYLAALLDDREKVGDGKGGATVVTHDSGYGIRTFGSCTQRSDTTGSAARRE